MSKKHRLPFEIDPQVDPGLLTSRAGLPLLIELFRACGAADAVDAHASVKRRRRGLTASQSVECLLSLWASGGERCEDLDRLREDAGLAALLGHEILASQTARDFLDGFHQEDLPLWQAGEFSSVPSESAPLAGLRRANDAVVAAAQSHTPETTATLDVDATILACTKRSAQRTYDGRRGYQPVLVLWAEQDLLIEDEMRDGNVPAGSGNRRVVQRAVESLPAGIERVRVRGDSALYEGNLLRWMERQHIEYAVSADMGDSLAAAIRALPEETWQTDREEADAVRQWAEVLYAPSDGDYRKDAPFTRRYLAIRIVKRQGELFGDGSDRRHFAVATNREGDGLDILRWHRGKAGTIEHAHDILTNELAAEALPSQKFGANAAWLRLNVLLYNLLSHLKRSALPGEMRTARPKRLRFLLFNIVGKVVLHARMTWLRLTSETARALWAAARTQIHRPVRVLAGE